MPLDRRSLLVLAAGPAPLLCGTAARADQAYPSRPIRWIVAYPPGGGSDLLARQIAPLLGSRLGTPIVIDNRPGAAGIVGTETAARQPGDGYTVLSGDNGAMIFHTALYKKLPYDPKDFVPVGFMANFPLLLAVAPASGISGARQLLDEIRRNPGRYSYASPGAGSPHHLAMELIKERSGSAVVHVPYRGTPAALQGVTSGQVSMIVVDAAASLAQVRDGRLRALAVLSRRRIPQLPEVPTLSEVGADRGLQDYEVTAWQALFAPRDTPQEIADRLGSALRRTLLAPEVGARLGELGLEVNPGDGAALSAFVRKETAFWHRLIADRHLALD